MSRETADSYPDLVSLRDAAEALGVGQDTLRNQIHKGKLAGFKLGRNWFVQRAELERYRSEHLGKAGRPLGS